MRLFIVGNGFDLAHGIPSRYNPDFKNIAERIEQLSYFWDIYQSRKADIWADFENLLANPDFNNLEEIFDGYAPDFSSDYERDRNAIITQVDLNGKLIDALYEFADQAENSIESKRPLVKYEEDFSSNGLFITTNYTHTLEKLYGINRNNVLHIHGEVGADNLILGYPEGDYKPETYFYDVRQKGRGPYREVNFEQHIEDMIQDDLIDYYTYTAYKALIDKTKSFSKAPQITLLEDFLKDNIFHEILVIGHSCAIDFPYFEYLNNMYPQAIWRFSPHNEDTRDNVEYLIKNLGISRYKIV